MIFRETPLPGLIVVEQQPAVDERGSLARLFCAETFAAEGLMDRIAQSSLSVNRFAGTLRGLHFQYPPHAERKLVQCTRGAIFDVAVDVRRASPTFGCWYAVELRAGDGLAVHICDGLAHGFQTLVDHTEVRYDISVPYAPDAAAGVAFDDPAVGVRWPAPPTERDRIVSERDRSHPPLDRLPASRIG